MKLKLSVDAEAGYFLTKPTAHDPPSYREIEISEAEYHDYLDLQRRVETWQKRLDVIWKSTRGKQSDNAKF